MPEISTIDVSVPGARQPADLPARGPDAVPGAVPPVPDALPVWRRELFSDGNWAILAGLLLIVLVVGASGTLALRNASALERVALTQEIRATVTRLIEDVTDAETGQRGFLLTGGNSYLEPFERGSADAPAALARLGMLAGDDAGVAAPLAGLRDAVPRKLAELAQTVDDVKTGRRDVALQTVRSGIGLRAMAEIRGFGGQLAATQQALLANQISAVELSGRLIVVIDALGLVTLLLLLAAIIRRTRRSMAVLRAAQASLAAANAELGGVNERLERKVAQRTADLTEANEEIQRFAYIVSHDLRAPLVNILGFTGELEAATRTIAGYLGTADGAAMPAEVVGAVRDDLPEAIRFIRASSQKMDRLIAAILKLSREGRRVMRLEPIDMGALLADLADTLRHQCEEAGARIVVGEVPDLAADRVMIEQIFGNLLENAIKYLAPGRAGEVTVSGRMRDGKAVLEVADNGRGIAPRDRERVFELFRRAGDQRVPGEGIGLAHVRALVRRLGGTIACESEEGVGSVFRVILPIEQLPNGEVP